VEPTLPPYIVDPNQEVGDISTSDSWDGVVSDPLMNEQVTRDPWGSMDTLMTSDPTMTDIASILPDIHDEAAELGPDVLADIAPMLDEVAAIDSSIAQTAASVGVDPGIINSAVDSRVIDSGFDSNLLQENLGDIDNYDVGDGDLVDMYAAAGPRDLDDGGPSFGDNSSAVLATNTFTRRIRKKKREMVKVRKALATCSFSGYRHFIFPISPDLNGKAEGASHNWPDKVQETWNALVQETKIDVIASSDLFSFPEVSIPEEVIGWNQDLLSSSPSFMVTLVTQCSLDRLKNLEELLARWKGSASVAVFIGDDDDKENAKALISGCIGRAHQRAQKANGEENTQWDVAVNLMQSIVPDSPYPINLLRNVALLAAKEHQRNLGVIDHAAVFLVDVDFRPSNNLHETLLSVNAADKIIQQKKAVVCPAFETKAGTDSPKRVSELISLFETAEADGFHVSHFPQGHSPTDFAEFTLRSRHLDEGSAIDCWKMTYEVRYIEGFEPYIVMATNYVPLYDERFQGYGLNKVSHLASVAKKTGGTFTVLPGVFVSAPEHQKSGSWSSIYGSSSIDAKFNRLCLKGLYRNFCARLQDEKEVMVSASTRCWNNKLTRLVNIDSLIVRPGLTSILDSVSPLPKGNDFMSLYVCLLQEIITQHMAKGEEGGMVNFQKGQHLNLKSTNVMEKLSSCVVESENEGEEGRLVPDNSRYPDQLFS